MIQWHTSCDAFPRSRIGLVLVPSISSQMSRSQSVRPDRPDSLIRDPANKHNSSSSCGICCSYLFYYRSRSTSQLSADICCNISPERRK